jgi:hypothetical protein
LGVALLAGALMLVATAGGAIADVPAEAFTFGALGGVPGALLLRAALTRPPGSARQRRWLGWAAVPPLMLGVPALGIGVFATRYALDGYDSAWNAAIAFDLIGVVLLAGGLWLLRSYQVS